MQRLTLAGGIPDELKGSIVALGNFDGFHLGHQAVVNRAIQRAFHERRPVIVATFEPHQTAVLRQLIERIRALGAEPLFLLTPRLDWDVAGGMTILNHAPLHAFRRTHDRMFGSVPLLHYYEPARYPEFYRPELWYDSHHLNGKGAALFSRRLGEDLEQAARPRPKELHASR